MASRDRPGKSKRRVSFTCLFGILLTLGLVCLCAGPFLIPPSVVQYDVLFLEHSGIPLAHTSCLNSKGEVAGFFRTKSKEWHGAVWSPGGKTIELGTLGGRWTTPRGINDRCVVVGSAETPDETKRAFRWNETDGMKDLGTLGGDEAYAYGINNWNVVVGQAQIEGGTWHAFIWDATRGMRGLATPEGSESLAFDVNDGGQVVGSVTLRGATEQAALWTETGELLQLGTLDGWETHARFINESGIVAGEARRGVQRYWRVFMWSAKEGMRELEGRGGSTTRVRGMNDRGRVVGLSMGRWEYTPMEFGGWLAIEVGSRFNSDTALRMADALARRSDDAVIWENGSLQRLQKQIQLDFNTSIHPYGINNSGQIIAGLLNWSGQNDGCALLTPKHMSRRDN